MKRISLPRLERTMPAQFTLLERVAGEPDDAPRRYDMSFSSEHPVKRWWGATEILDHSASSVRMQRMNEGASVLLNHRDHIGVVLKARVEGGVGRAVVAFSPNNPMAQMVERDVSHPMQFRRHVSVGYAIHGARVEEIDGNDETWRVTDWEPLEVSIVDVPADPTVGISRSSDAVMYEAKVEERQAKEEVTIMGATAVETKNEEVTPIPGVDLKSTDAADIARMADANGCNDKLGDWFARKLSIGQVAQEILALRKTQGQAVSMAGDDVLRSIPKKVRGRYNYARAIRGAMVMKGATDMGVQKFDGLEREWHDELLRARQPYSQYHDGILVPMRFMTDEEMEERAMDSKTLSKGAEFVTEQAGELIDLLRNRSVMMSLGARTLTGLNAPIAFPKQAGGMTVYWVGENPPADVTASDATFGLALLAPKNLMGQGAYSRQLLAIGNRDVDTLIRDELAMAHALAFDKAGIHGKGASGEPTGIYYTADVNVVAMGGAPTFAKLIDMQTEVAKDNADLGNMGYVTTPGEAGKMRQTLVASSAGSEMLWVGNMRDGLVAGYRAMASNQISSTMTNSEPTGGAEQGCVFGNFGDVIMGFFTALELIVDPLTLAGRAMVKITSFQMGDILIRRGQSFCKTTGLTA